MADFLADSTISPSGDLLFKLTLTRTSDDIDPNTGEPTDYQDCGILVEFVLSSTHNPIAALTIGSGISRVTNSASSQLVVVALSQAILSQNKGKKIYYRITITTTLGAKISGGTDKPGYFGKFNIRRF